MAKLEYSGLKASQIKTSISATATEIAAEIDVSTLNILDKTDLKSFIFLDTKTNEFQSCTANEKTAETAVNQTILEGTPFR